MTHKRPLRQHSHCLYPNARQRLEGLSEVAAAVTMEWLHSVTPGLLCDAESIVIRI